MKLPSFQFYPQDWRSDPGLRACTREERSVWLDLLCIMHDSPRRGVLLLPTGEPMPVEEIARNIGETRTKTVHFLEKIAQRGVSSTEEETGALFSRRMVSDEYISQLRRSSGSLGGNPALVNSTFSLGSTLLSTNSKLLAVFTAPTIPIATASPCLYFF